MLVDFRSVEYARVLKTPLMELRLAMSFYNVEIVTTRLAR